METIKQTKSKDEFEENLKNIDKKFSDLSKEIISEIRDAIIEIAKCDPEDDGNEKDRYKYFDEEGFFTDVLEIDPDSEDEYIDEFTVIGNNVFYKEDREDDDEELTNLSCLSIGVLRAILSIFVMDLIPNDI